MNGTSRDGALSEANVVIDRVTAHASGGWVTVRDNVEVPVNVLRLGDHAVDLGFRDLPAGKITQIRLHVSLTATAPYVVTESGEQIPLKVPSGMQSGIKIKGPWNVGECEEVAVDINLDGKKSIWIHPTGHEDLYVLRPVIKTGKHVGTIEGCTPSDGDDDDADSDSDSDGDSDDNDGTDGDADGDGVPDSSDGDADGDGVPDGSGDPVPGENDPTTGDPSGDGSTDGTPDDGSSGGDNPDSTDGTSGTPDANDGSTDSPPTGGSCTSNAECSAIEFCDETGSCVVLSV
jgi:hypothetical protein